VRLLPLAGLTLTATLCRAADPSQYKDEDLRAVQLAFKKADAALDWFQVLDKKPIHATGSILLVEAAPTQPQPGVSQRSPVYAQSQIGLFVVTGKDNKVRRVLDTYPLGSQGFRPVLDEPSERTAYLHFYSAYGFYRGSIKYFFDAAGGAPPRKVRYGALALTAVTRESGKLRYQASFGKGAELPQGWNPRSASITIEPREGDSLPSYQIADTAQVEEAPALAPSPVPVAGRQTVLIVHTGPADQPAQVAGITLTSAAGIKHFWPLPVPLEPFFRRVRPERGKPEELENDFGPIAVDGTQVWFANSFYDGEGISGVGALGSFDTVTHEYKLRYLPEIVPWSGSALLVDGRDLWVGLMRRPEGANYGGGLLRYNMDTGAVTKYAVKDLIYTLDRGGGVLYCGTSNGLYTIRDDKVMQLRFEPDADGKLTMIAHEIR